MRKLILLGLIFCFGKIFAQSGSGDFKALHIKLTDSTQFVKPANTGSLVYFSQNNTWYIVENGVKKRLRDFSSAGGAWPLTGVGTLTGDVLMEGTYDIELGSVTSNINGFEVVTSNHLDDFSTDGVHLRARDYKAVLESYNSDGVYINAEFEATPAGAAVAKSSGNTTMQSYFGDDISSGGTPTVDFTLWGPPTSGPFSSGGAVFTDNRGSTKGIQYAGSGYVNDALSLTTKEYVDAAVAGGGGSVTSVFGRSGVVVATPGDYSISDITNGLSNVLSSGHIFVGDVSNLASDVAVSGDVTISSSGVVAIGASKVTNAMLAGSITDANILSSSNWNTAYNRSGTSLTFTSSTFTFTKQDASMLTASVPTFNQNTTGTAAAWTTARNLAGNSVDGSGNVAFTNKFIVQGTTDVGLSNAQFLGALTTGLVKNTTTTGVLSIAVSGTDYQAPITFGTGALTALGVNVGSSGAFVVNGGAGGTPSSMTGTNITGIPESGVTNLTTDLSGKQATLVSGTNIRTVNGNTLLGNTDLVISGGVTSIGSADASVTITNPTTTPDLKVVKINQGTTYTQVGVLLDELFPGSTLNATNWSGSLPTGASISSKLIIASGASDWTRYIQLQKFFPFEKETFEIYFKAVTKNSGDAWGLSQNLTLLASGNQSIYIKFDQSNGANSGMLSIGNTTAANEYGYSQALAWSAGDQLKLTITKKPGKCLTLLENITTPTALKAYGDFPVDIRTTGGQYKLSFLGGQQEFSEFKVTSNCRNFGGTFGVVFIGDSQTNGSGNTDMTFRWASLLMKNQSHLFEVLGIATWSTTTFTSSRVTEFLSGISAKYLVINTGYNDFQFNSGAPATYETALETIATTAQGLGYTVVFVSMVPAFTGADNTSFDAQMVTAATNTSSRYISVRAALSSGVKLNPNYVNTDGIHINDEGSLVMANTIKTTANDLYSQFLIDYNNSDVRTNSLPVEKSAVSLVGVDHDGRQYKVDPSNYLNKNYPILYQGTLRAQQTGSIGITGKIVVGGPIQQLNSSAQGLQLGFNDGTNGSTSTNINITNAGVDGVGSPQAFANITGLRNIEILALSSAGKPNASHTISGNDNLLIGSNLGNSSVNLSGSNNTVFSSIRIGGFTSAHDNIGIGAVFSGLATGSYNIAFSPLVDTQGSNDTWASAASGTIFMGTPWDGTTGVEALANGETVICGYNSAAAQKIFTFGPKGGKATSVIWRAGYQGGTDVTGYTHYIDAPRGTGTGQPGDIRFRFSVPGSTGTTVHSTYTEGVIFSRAGTTLSQAILTAAWAPVLNITPAAHTGMTASTAFPDVVLASATQTWGSGTIAIQPKVWLKANTLAGTSGTNTATIAATLQVDPWIVGSNAAITNGFTIYHTGKQGFDQTITTPGTTGNQTINKPAGTVNIAAAGTTVTVTNSFVTANSHIYATIETNDATARIANITHSSGSFVINIVACTSEVAIAWRVEN